MSTRGYKPTAFQVYVTGQEMRLRYVVSEAVCRCKKRAVHTVTQHACVYNNDLTRRRAGFKSFPTC